MFHTTSAIPSQCMLEGKGSSEGGRSRKKQPRRRKKQEEAAPEEQEAAPEDEVTKEATEPEETG